MAPVVHGLEEKYGEAIDFVYLDIEDPQTQPLQKKLDYDTRWLPFFLFVSADGEVVAAPLIGYVNGETFEAALINFLEAEGLNQGN